MKYLLLFLLCSCSAVQVTRPMMPKFAPKGYKPRGEISYLNQGSDSIIQSRREDAFRQMYTSCNSEYKIISEGEKFDASLQSNWHITYECEVQ